MARKLRSQMTSAELAEVRRKEAEWRAKNRATLRAKKDAWRRSNWERWKEKSNAARRKRRARTGGDDPLSEPRNLASQQRALAGWGQFRRDGRDLRSRLRREAEAGWEYHEAFLESVDLWRMAESL